MEDMRDRQISSRSGERIPDPCLDKLQTIGAGDSDHGSVTGVGGGRP